MSTRTRRTGLALTGVAAVLAAALVAAPAQADVIAHPKVGKTCVDSSGLVRIQTATTFYDNQTTNLWDNEQAVFTQQRLDVTTGAWVNSDWATSAHLTEWANGVQYGNQYGPQNPPTSVTFNFTGVAALPKTQIFTQYAVSSSSYNIRCNVTPNG